MFTKSAGFYDTLYATKDYAGAAVSLHELIEADRPGASTLLDVACGTGRHLEHFRHWYHVEGLDINADLLKLAADRCPGVPLHHQDMSAFTLGRQFDVVTCLFSAIGYLVTPEKLVAAVGRMAAHMAPRGVMLIEPFFTPDQYWTDRLTANYSVSETHRVAWMYVSARQGNVAIAEIHYLVGEGLKIEYFRERHEVGLYTPEDYALAFQNADLTWTFEPVGPFGRGLYIARN